MDKDPDKPAWLHIGSVVPEGTIPPRTKVRREEPRTVFNLDAIIDAFEAVMDRNSIPSSGISLPRGVPTVARPFLSCGSDLADRVHAGFRPQSRELRGKLALERYTGTNVIGTGLFIMHRVLHGWLSTRLSKGDFLGDSNIPSYIEQFFDKRDRDIPQVPGDESREEWFYMQLDGHNDEHGYFQLWCIFREATCLLTGGRAFPEWLVQDLEHLAGQVRIGLRRGRGAANLVRAVKGPPTWAAEVLKMALGVQAVPDLPVTLCKLCELPFEERRRGRPSPYCPHCRLLARERKERERKKGRR